MIRLKVITPEQACALDFLVYGDSDERGPHADRCVHARCVHCHEKPSRGPCPELMARARDTATRYVEPIVPGESPLRARLRKAVAKAHARIEDNLVGPCEIDSLSPCSRDYDPRPYPEAEPDHMAYQGTGIGSLYGLGFESVASPAARRANGSPLRVADARPRPFTAQLAGWNLS